MSQLISTPRMQAFDSNGDPLVGGKVYFYEAGTSTLKNTYSDAALTIANANPVVLDSRGEALIFGSGQYKVIIHNSDDVLQYPIDNFYFDALRADLASTTIGGGKGSNLVSNEPKTGEAGVVNHAFWYGVSERYGMVADSTTDNAAFAKNWIESSIALGVACTLPGVAGQTYKIASTVKITIPTGVNPSTRMGGISFVGDTMYTSILEFTGTGYCLDFASLNAGQDVFNMEKMSIKSTTGGGVYLAQGGQVWFDQFFMDGCGATYWGLKLDGTVNAGVSGAGFGIYNINIVNSRFWHTGTGYKGGAIFIDNFHTLTMNNNFISKQGKDGDIVYLNNGKSVAIPTIVIESDVSNSYTSQTYISLNGTIGNAWIGSIYAEGVWNTLIKSVNNVKALRIEHIYGWQRNDGGNGDPNCLIFDGTANDIVDIGTVYYVGNTTAAVTNNYLIDDPYGTLDVKEWINQSVDSTQLARELKLTRENNRDRSFKNIGTTATPSTTFKLGFAGAYLVTTTWTTADNNHAMSALWRVTFDDSTNDFTFTELIGTKNIKGGAAVQPSDITLTVDNAGLCTTTAAVPASNTWGLYYGWSKITDLSF